ncbi:GNAT family N-acetyltransferase [Arthrobacter sp. ZGTC412]|uniref:GNAT family N-acetyltransferase n=1 Tax=Arthrobacter sp. ZGTC412 TaxID=2058900 RepID=UPI000CE518B1|nr:GNAT family N-acetyltransferase [Arthrobacter sp. ZGTC412]
MSRFPDVSLVDVDETVLEQLLALAKRDASPDEVAPPLGGPGWNLERTAWFFSYHRAAAEGLTGDAAEKTWGILADGSLAGSIRLRRLTSGSAETGSGTAVAETGIWLGRSFRSRGIGSAAFRLVLSEARNAGVTRVTARTLTGNLGAQRLLASAGAVLRPDDDGTVSAVVVL